jgi:predicted outer membrane repeat protein
LGFGERGIAEIYSTQQIVDTNWHHIAVVKNGDASNNVTFYVDGVASGSGSAGTVTVPSGPKQIGALLDGSFVAHFNGSLDDVRLYNRALTAAEVLRLAQGQGCITDGTTWTTAFRELQCGLNAAVAGDQVWIGQGVYKPGVSVNQAFLLKNGVNLYGGFLGLSMGGGETALGQRPAFNPDAPLTVLSGDVRGDDLPATFGNYSDNTIRVLSAGTGTTATLDGLAVRSGNAFGALGTLASVGGGLLANLGTNLTLNKMVLTANRSNGNGGAIFSQAPLQLTNVTFYSNTAGASGGALAITTTLTVNGSTFQNNQAAAAGAIFANGSATIAGSTFRSNQVSTFEGGAIKTSAPLTVTGSTFLNNLGRFGGGAIETIGGLKIRFSNFQQNQATVFTGGAIDAQAGIVDIQSSSFVSNTATQDGGAIFSGSGSVTINNSELIGNKSLGGNCLPTCTSGNGGAIFSFSPLTVTQTTLLNNFARLNGGGVAGEGGTVVMNSTFTGNKAGTLGDAITTNSKGGGIFVSGGASLINNVFQGNAAQSTNSDGGGLYVASGSLLSSGNLYSANTATRFGGGARVAGLISGDRFLNNTAASEGGGVLATGNLTVTHTLFDGNASSLSGGISAQGPTITRTMQLNVDNSLFIRNQRVTSVSSGATDMRLFDITARLVNNTFADPGTGGATSINIFRVDLLANNNIFANYGTSLNVGQVVSDLQEDYNLFFNAPTGMGVTSGGHSLTSNPLFVNPGGQDYRLTAFSPAREAGLDSALPASILHDLGGGARRVGNIDIGAYEFQIQLFLPDISK